MLVVGFMCFKRLYFEVHQPDLAEEADEGQEARLEQGREVGLLAQQSFPGGVFVGFEDGIDYALRLPGVGGRFAEAGSRDLRTYHHGFGRSNKTIWISQTPSMLFE
jgi:hypothetical protein